MRREAALALALVACGARAEPPHCPSGTHPDPNRASAIETRLGSVDEGRALLASARASIPRVCFADPPSASVITTERIVILDRDLDEDEAAARLGHLLVHARDGLPIEVVAPGLVGPSCDAAVERALALEARAYVVEIALQHVLGTRPRHLAFEFVDGVRAAPTEARESIVLTYLRDHPSGGPGIEGLADAYRARCAAR